MDIFFILVLVSSVFLISSWYEPWTIFTSDSYEYLSVAIDSYSLFSRERPIGYPALLRLVMQLGSGDWVENILRLQLLLQLCAVSIIYCVFKYFSSSSGFSFLASFISALAPGLMLMSHQVMADYALAVVVMLLWLLVIFMVVGSLSNTAKILLAIFIGLLSGLAALLKPVWLIGFLPIIVILLFHKKISLTKRLKLISLIFIFHVLPCAFWLMHLYTNFDQLTFSRIGSINMNILAIESGLAGYASDTKLANYFKKQGNWSEISNLGCRTYSGPLHTRAVPRELKYDSSFAVTAISNKPFRYLACQAPRIGYFFVTSFPVDHHLLRGCMHSKYSMCNFYVSTMVFWKYFYAIGLIASFASFAIAPRFRMILFTNWIFLGYGAFMTTFFTYRMMFSRQRVAFEYILLINALLGFYLLLFYYKKNMHNHVCSILSERVRFLLSKKH